MVVVAAAAAVAVVVVVVVVYDNFYSAYVIGNQDQRCIITALIILKINKHSGCQKMY